MEAAINGLRAKHQDVLAAIDTTQAQLGTQGATPQARLKAVNQLNRLITIKHSLELANPWLKAA